MAGLVLLGSPAWAQEDPCAPGADGSVPEMCQSGPVEESEPATEPGAEPVPDPCAGSWPVEPGDGEVTDEGDQAIDVGEPYPGAPPSDVVEDPAAESQSPERIDPEQTDATTADAWRSSGAAPGAVGDEGIICAFTAPQSGPAAPAVRGGATGAGSESAAGELPRTGSDDRVLALGAVGTVLVVGAGAVLVARRRHAGSGAFAS